MRCFFLLLILMFVLSAYGSSTSASDKPVLQDECGSELNEDCLDLEGAASAVLNIDPPDIDPESVVVSVASFWRESDRTGGACVRVWSRQELIEEFTFLDVQVERVDFRIRSSSLAGSRAELFDIVFTQPEAESSESILEQVTYDLISIFGIPTSTIEVVVNDVISGPISIEGVSGSGNKAIIGINEGSQSETVDLPASIPFRKNTDQEISGQGPLGLQVYFEYELRGAMETEKFPIEASARIIYGVSRRGEMGPFFRNETNYASITYLTTGQFSKVYLPLFIQ